MLQETAQFHVRKRHGFLSSVFPFCHSITQGFQASSLGRLCCGELPDFSGDRGKQEEARSQTNVTGRFVAISTKNMLKMLAHVPAKQSKYVWKSSFNSCASGVSKKLLILGPTRLLDTMNFQVSVA